MVYGDRFISPPCAFQSLMYPRKTYNMLVELHNRGKRAVGLKREGLFRGMALAMSERIKVCKTVTNFSLCCHK